MLKTMANRVNRSHKQVDNKQEIYEEEIFVDPASIMIYITIIREIVKITKRCREAKSVPVSAQQPTIFEKAVIKRVVRRKLGFKRYLKEGKKITKSVFEVGAGSTVEEIEELYGEV